MLAVAGSLVYRWVVSAVLETISPAKNKTGKKLLQTCCCSTSDYLDVDLKGATGIRWHGIAHGKLLETLGCEGLTNRLDETMKQGRCLKDGSKSLVSHVHFGDTQVVIKGYRHLGYLHSLRHTFKGSRAHSAWLLANRLIGLGIPTPKPLAFIDVYRGCVLWCSYFIYEYAEGPSLHEILKDPDTTRERKKRFIDHVLALLWRLAENGISHGDLKHTNMICRGDQVALIDLDALRPVIGPAFLRRWRYERDKARFLRDVERIGKQGY